MAYTQYKEPTMGCLESRYIGVPLGSGQGFWVCAQLSTKCAVINGFVKS